MISLQMSGIQLRLIYLSKEQCDLQTAVASKHQREGRDGTFRQKSVESKGKS